MGERYEIGVDYVGNTGWMQPCEVLKVTLGENLVFFCNFPSFSGVFWVFRYNFGLKRGISEQSLAGWM